MWKCNGIKKKKKLTSQRQLHDVWKCSGACIDEIQVITDPDTFYTTTAMVCGGYSTYIVYS